MKFEPKLLKPLSHRIPEAPRVSFVLESNDNIVCIPHDDQFAGGLPPSPLFGPSSTVENEYFFQIKQLATAKSGVALQRGWHDVDG